MWYIDSAMRDCYGLWLVGRVRGVGVLLVAAMLVAGAGFTYAKPDHFNCSAAHHPADVVYESITPDLGICWRI